MQSLRRIAPLILVSIVLWALTLIATPIFLWTIGKGILPLVVGAGVLVQAVTMLVTLWQGVGMGTALRAILPILFFAWLVEFIGSRTGFPFGQYAYTGILQPQVGGVPLLIPLAWLMLLPASWVVALRVVTDDGFSHPVWVRLGRAGVAALAFTAWDLGLDPQMVSWGFWTWEKAGLYFGIPLTNYLGWLVVSFLFTLLYLPSRLPETPLMLMYAITWFLTSFGLAFFWGLPGPAVFCFLGMGGMLAWACLRRRNESKPD